MTFWTDTVILQNCSLL